MTNPKEKSLLYLEPEDKKMISKLSWRSLVGAGTYQYEKMQGLTYVYAMIPVIKRYYSNKEDQIKALKRYWTIFNVTPAFFAPIAALTASMEKEAAENKDYDVSSINAVKSSLMGPMSAIGDSIFWGSLKVIATGVGVSYALQGSILGPILYAAINLIPAAFFKHFLPRITFNQGSSFIVKLNKNGTLNFVTNLCSIVGLMTIGSMACSMVKLSIPLELNLGNGQVVAIQSIFDGILPAMLPVGFTLIIFKLLKKDVNPTLLIFIIIIVSIICKYFGLL